MEKIKNDNQCKHKKIILKEHLTFFRIPLKSAMINNNNDHQNNYLKAKYISASICDNQNVTISIILIWSEEYGL